MCPNFFLFWGFFGGGAQCNGTGLSKLEFSRDKKLLLWRRGGNFEMSCLCKEKEDTCRLADGLFVSVTKSAHGRTKGTCNSHRPSERDVVFK